MGAAPSLGDTYQTESYSIPALQVNYDLGLAKWFSIGAALSYQAMGLDYTNWEYIDDNGDWQTIDFSAKIGRANAALRFLFHYANQDRIDLYQGVRVGYLMWNTKTEVSETVFDPETDLNLNFGRPSVQLVLFGMRGYVTENIGLSTELAVGAPHFLTVGANYRF